MQRRRRTARCSMPCAACTGRRVARWPARPAGTHHSKQRGTSAEFTEYRLYRQGDDPRRIDWRLLARSDRAYIRLATDRAVLPTTIVLDASASMAFPLAHARRSGDRAQEIAVGLAAVVHADGDPVGVAVHDDRGGMRVLPPRTRRGVVGEIARVDRCRGSRRAAIRSRRRVAAIRSAAHRDHHRPARRRRRVAARGARARRRGRRSAPRAHRRARGDRSAAPHDPRRRSRSSRRCSGCSSTRRDAGYDRAFGEWRARWRGVARGGRVVRRSRDRRAAPHAVRRIAEPPALGAERADELASSLGARDRVASRRSSRSRCISSRAAGRSPNRCRRRASFPSGRFTRARARSR